MLKKLQVSQAFLLGFLVNLAYGGPSFYANVINYGYINISSTNPLLLIPEDTTVNVYDSGWTTLSAGRLIVNGTLNGMTVYITGGILSGTGTVNMWGGVFNVSGTVKPGSDSQIGQLNIVGDYNQSSQGTLLITIDPSGASLLNVSQTANLSGSLRGAGLNGFIPAVGTQYVILTAGSVSGTFTGSDAFISPLLFLKPTYHPNDVTVTVTRNYFNPNLTRILSHNELIMLSKMNQFAQFPPNSDMQGVINTFDLLPNNANVIQALDSLEPIGDDVLLSLAVASMSFSHLMLNQYYLPFNTLPGLSLIIAGNGYDGSLQDLLETNSYHVRGLNEMIGLNYAATPTISVGIRALANLASASLSTHSQVNDRNFLIAPYLIYQSEPWYVNALIAGGLHSYDLDRSITIGPLHRTASSHPNANEFLSYLGAGYNYNSAKEWQIGPDVAIQFVNLNVSDYTESGAQSLNLAVASRRLSATRSLLGGHFAYETHFTAYDIQPIITAAYVHDFENTKGMAFSWINAGGSTTLLSDQSPQRNFAFINAGLQFIGHQTWKIMLNYSGLITSSQSINAISAQAIVNVV